uniref:Uncharacterized protein n=1 Tax=Arion vulgaris TaxID=1028688 RepID=A0A0B7AXK2_9EUPU
MFIAKEEQTECTLLGSDVHCKDRTIAEDTLLEIECQSFNVHCTVTAIVDCNLSRSGVNL